MKRVLSILLAMSLVLSLGACGGGGKDSGGTKDTPVSGTDAATVSNNTDDADSSESDAPKRVTGDRVPLHGEDTGPKYMPTDWTVGPIDPEDLFVKERMPLDTNNFKLTVSGELEGGGLMKMLFAVKGDQNVFEMETSKDNVSMMTRFFDQDGESYMYMKGFEADASVGKLYRLVDTPAEDTEDGDSVVDGEEPTDPIDLEPVPGESLEGGVSSIKDALGVGDITDSIDEEGMNPDNYKTVEYVDLIAGNDTFKAVTKKDEEMLILVDHTTGWIVGVNQVSGGEDIQKMAIRIDYEVKEDLVYDVSEAEDINAEEAMMALFAQFFMLVDFGDIGSD